MDLVFPFKLIDSIVYTDSNFLLNPTDRNVYTALYYSIKTLAVSNSINTFAVPNSIKTLSATNPVQLDWIGFTGIPLADIEVLFIINAHVMAVLKDWFCLYHNLQLPVAIFRRRTARV